MNDAAHEAALRAALGAGLLFVGACLVLSAPVVLVRGVANFFKPRRAYASSIRFS